MFLKSVIAIFLTLVLFSCSNPFSVDSTKKALSESFTMDNYYPKNWNVYKDNVYIGILYANSRTKFVGNFKGTHSIEGQTSSGMSWWGPYNYTFSEGQNIKEWLSSQPDTKGPDDQCDTTKEIVVNF